MVLLRQTKQQNDISFFDFCIGFKSVNIVKKNDCNQKLQTLNNYSKSQ